MQEVPLSAELIEKLYLYAYKRTQNTFDAEDLSQEIVLEVLKSQAKGVSPKMFEAWFWGLAHNVWCKWLRQKKASSLEVFYVEGGKIPALCSNPVPENNLLDLEEIQLLNQEIAKLSSLHREIIILYYLQELPLLEISNKLDVPLGTVKRRLYDAREKVKRGMKQMEASGRRSYAPVELNLFGGYQLPKYWPEYDRILVKNIFAAAYKKPITLEKLAEELGVARIYLEEEVDKFTKWGFLKKHGANRYITNFVILDISTTNTFAEEVGKVWQGLGKKMVDALGTVEDKIRNINFYGNQFAWEYLRWILLVYACKSYVEMAHADYKKRWENKGLPVHEWDYRIGGIIKRPEAKIPKIKKQTVSWSNLHQFFGNVAGFKQVEYVNFYQEEPFLDRDELINSANAEILVKLSKDSKAYLQEHELEYVANLVQKGILIKQDGAFIPQIPIFEKQARYAIEQIINQAIKQSVKPEHLEQVFDLADKIFLPTIPEELYEQYVNWIMQISLWPLPHVLYQCLEEGLLVEPEDYAKAPHALYLCLYN